ncbi:unnamed protein product [Amoebophrya sp. A120]|nr:unnamed protein product [Amoebophrya sp. A120]|eukprot:GSA120T00002598001.1
MTSLSDLFCMKCAIEMEALKRAGADGNGDDRVDYDEKRAFCSRSSASGSDGSFLQVKTNLQAGACPSMTNGGVEEVYDNGDFNICEPSPACCYRAGRGCILTCGGH